MEVSPALTLQEEHAYKYPRPQISFRVSVVHSGHQVWAEHVVRSVVQTGKGPFGLCLQSSGRRIDDGSRATGYEVGGTDWHSTGPVQRIRSGRALVSSDGPNTLSAAGR